MSEPAKNWQKPLRLFYSYAREDEDFLKQLQKHLAPLEREKLITSWYDRYIMPGSNWSEVINERLSASDIILLLVSPDFMASDYIYNVEINTIGRLRGNVTIIPIIVRPVDWSSTPFAHIQALPRSAKPVSQWEDRDAAFADIAYDIRRVCEEIQMARLLPEPSSLSLSVSGSALEKTGSGPTLVSHRLVEVFVKSGTPEITFVEQENFIDIQLLLEQAGRGLVIEGPSGVGKTTSIEKALESLQSRAPIQKKLSARNPEHRLLLQTLRTWHQGTVIIDDFHRLDASLRQDLVDYLKELADNVEKTNKLAIVGIPLTGQALVDIAFDLATRVDIRVFGHVKDELILQMIDQGEEALNIKFDRKSEIVHAANGSLNLAQYLCFNLCARAKILETQEHMQIVRIDIRAAIEQVMADLKWKFEKPIRYFVAMGGPRDVTCLRLIEELATAEDGFLSLKALKNNKSDLASGIERFIEESWMDKLYEKYPETAQHLFFDQVRQALIIDDPQLAFYLRQLLSTSLAREVGKITALAERKVFISYSHKDAEWLRRLRVYLKPIEREGIIDLWDDTKIAAGLQWREEIKNALETARVAILLVSADFLASDFIAEQELPTLLENAQKGGTRIIPLILSPSLYESTKLGAFQALNDPKHPLISLPRRKQDEILLKIAQLIVEIFRAE